jgi:hypothetical protein
MACVRSATIEKFVRRCRRIPPTQLNSRTGLNWWVPASAPWPAYLRTKQILAFRNGEGNAGCFMRSTCSLTVAQLRKWQSMLATATCHLSLAIFGWHLAPRRATILVKQICYGFERGITPIHSTSTLAPKANPFAPKALRAGYFEMN